MRSTFQGLEIGKRALFTQQGALHTVSHNIANQNTPGYSRQRVNFIQTEPFPTASLNRPDIPGQMGTGVKAGSIQRIRDSFYDFQYRGENTKFGYYASKSDALSKMEDVLNEPSDSGLAKVLNLFWNSLEDLSVHPENEGTRKVVLQRGEAVGETFKYLRSSLEKIQGDLSNEIDVSMKNVNSILAQIADLNRQIAEVEPHGFLPNDLYDKRDLLVDQLSGYFDIEVRKESNGGNSLDIAEGNYKIYIKGADGKNVQVVGKDSYEAITVVKKGGNLGPVTDVKIGDRSIMEGTEKDGVKMPSGKIQSLIESYGYEYKDGTDSKVTGLYPEMIDDLDKMAYSFVKMFNEVHSRGYGLDGKEGKEFFEDLGDDYKGAAGKVKMNADLKPSEIAASTDIKEADPNDPNYDPDDPGKVKAGNGTNAINLANIKDILIEGGSIEFELEGFDDPDKSKLSMSDLAITDGTVMTFYEGLIGGLGVDAEKAKMLASNSATLRLSVDYDRLSVSSVNIDEEFIDMIRFQSAYNAAARSITVVDEMLDKIINGMGIVGR